ncbi:murein hydrolase activator EnvC family protein [Gilvimarinus sp. F26214L]|uniref:murein hydrolase activator EnvC family protein n=1 Tax=Gilvimarinus sp. DZF01 TaxID=3461371 RepID=UPI0040463739
MRNSFTLLVALTGIALCMPVSAENVSEAEYQARLEALQKNIGELQQELNAVKGNRDQLLTDLQENETSIGELLEKIESIKRELKEDEQALLQLHRERKQLAGEQSSQKKHVAQQVRAAYQLGGQSTLKLLLNQHDPQSISRLLKYHDYVLTAQSAKIAAYVEGIERLNTIEPRIVENTRRLKRNRTRLQRRHDELQNRQRERQQMLARLEATIKTKDEELQKLNRDRRQVEELMSRIVAKIGTGSTFNQDAPFADLHGKLPWPANGRLAHQFGSERIAGKMKWSGVMIRAPEGSPVRAIHHGRVVFADYLRGHGLLIIVDHGAGYMSLYAHNQSLKKNVGNWVEAGEVIASVGSSGGQPQAGLYFEIRQNGRPTNPNRWCG